MSQRRVWVVGLGAISAAGKNVPETLAGFERGQRHFSPTALPVSTLQVPTYQVTSELPALPAPLNDSRTLRLAWQATCEALAAAGFPASFPPGARVGVALGTTVASQLNHLEFYRDWREQRPTSLQPVHTFLQTNPAEAIAGLLHLAGPRLTVCNACSSGTDAIGLAAEWIRAGLCDLAIAGGADELSLVPLAGFHALGVMSAQPCAPFDRHRQGLNLGEGAGVVILESSAHAAARGCTPLCELAGYGAACDAHHLTAPHPQGRGLAQAIAQALSQAQAAPEQLAFINAHGTATLDNDRVEGFVFQEIFQKRVPFLSTKGYTGHTLGAAGGLEAVFTVLGLREGWIPPSAGFVAQAEDIPLAPVRDKTIIAGDAALSTSLAFGGNNAALLFRRCM